MAEPTPFHPSDPAPVPITAPLVWHHIEPEFLQVGPAAMQTAKTASWSSQPTETNARHLRALVVMSLQAATLRSEPQDKLGQLRAELYADDEHNSAGATLARTIQLVAPSGPAMVTTSLTTFGGSKATPMPLGTGAMPAVAVVAIVVAVSAAAALIADRTAEVVDSTNFRNNRTQQLLATQARTVEVIAKHAEREKAAGRSLPFDAEERQLIGLLDETQRQIANERRQPLPSPFDGAREWTDSLSNLAREAGGVLKNLLPVALVGGALYLLLRAGRDPPPTLPEPKREESQRPGVINLTRNEDGVYVYDQ
jgi:hypothetical protein